MGKSPVEAVMERRTSLRKALAVERAVATLSALDQAGLKAWLVGSLAKDRFGLHSDVDILVECDANSELRAFKIVEAEMRGFPSQLIPTCDLNDEALGHFLRDAIDASGVRARS